MIDVARDDKQFRRGVVLGLTMAEILLLLIFLLMLLLVSKLFEERRVTEERTRELSEVRIIVDDLRRRGGGAKIAFVDIYSQLTAERDSAAAKVKELSAALDELRLRSAATDFDITKEYVRVQQERDQALASLGAMKPIIEQIEEAQHTTPNLSTDAAAQNLADHAKVGQAVLEQAQQIAPGAGPGEAIDKLQAAAALGDTLQRSGNDPNGLLTAAASCKQELQSCQGQTAFLNNRLNSQIGGRGKKPCWASLQGSIQFIFNTRLRPEGIVVVDNRLPGRAEDQAKLPLKSALFDQPLTQAQFGNAFGALLSWSEASDCRFYVNLIDETGAGEKSIYKDMRRTVEGYFYIRDVR